MRRIDQILTLLNEQAKRIAMLEGRLAAIVARDLPGRARPSQVDRPPPRPTSSIVQRLRERIVNEHDRLGRIEARLALEELS